jgi:hypothetical protein
MSENPTPTNVPPTLTTARLVLRPFVLADAPDVQRLCNVRDIALNTLLIPHPYPDGMAEQWISSQPDNFAKGEVVTFAITLAQAPLVAHAYLLQHASGLGVAREVLCEDAIEPKPFEAVLDDGTRSLGREAPPPVRNTDPVAHFGSIALELNAHPDRTHQFTPFAQAHKKWGEYVDSELYAILRSDVPGLVVK